MEMLKEDYNLATSNCSETVQAGLSAAGLDDGSLGFWKTYLRSLNPINGSNIGAVLDAKSPKNIYPRIIRNNPGGRIVKCKDFNP